MSSIWSAKSGDTASGCCSTDIRARSWSVMHQGTDVERRRHHDAVDVAPLRRRAWASAPRAAGFLRLAAALAGPADAEVDAAGIECVEHAEGLHDRPPWCGRAARRRRRRECVSVAAAIWPISTAGAELATATKWCSAIQYRLYPHCSACCARSTVLRSAVAASPPSRPGRGRGSTVERSCRPPWHSGCQRRADRVARAASRRRGRRCGTRLLAAAAAPPRRR